MTEIKLIITPKTKLFDLLESYPQLEKIITELVPALIKLKNPVLRQTIGKVSTIQQVAVMGNIGVDKLINLLRKEVGQDSFESVSLQNNQVEMATPAWFDRKNIGTAFDVRPMLAAGEHPVHQVMSDLNQLPEGKIYQITASFLPLPLIEKAKSVGFMDFVEKVYENEFNVYFFKK